MDYGNIPNKVLDLGIGEDYITGNYTLRDELKDLKEDVIWAEWEAESDTLHTFHAWSKNYVAILVRGLFGDKYLTIIDRNPPKPRITQKKAKK